MFLNKTINGARARQLFREAISGLWYPGQHVSKGEAGEIHHLFP